jgi:hypothetical protein
MTDWTAVGVNALAAAAVGVLLWTFLPRGAVLTRAVRSTNWRGEPLLDTWQVENIGPVPIRLRSVKVVGPALDEELPWGGAHGVYLELDDETSDIARTDWQRPWNEVVVGPGDTLQVRVGTNNSLLIDYRRAGWSGVLERRSIAIHGGV